MAEETELIKKAYESFNKRDIEATLSNMHINVSWPNAMEGGYVHGHQEVRDYWTRQWSKFDPHVEPVKIEADGAGHFIVDVHQVVHDISGKLLLDRMIQHVYVIEEGLIRSMEIIN